VSVRIHHPGWDRTVSVPADLWPGRLAPKGWQLAEGEVVPDLDDAAVENERGADAVSETADDIITTPPTRDLSERDQLHQTLRDRGVTFHHRLGVEKLRKLVEETA